ncbi:helix-turn-helix transcriptional regulator [Hoeflea sp. Naph1]|uniref:helix-turn-helix transcriptional regulator n=1 Tax=Hoeflea sp. Naph1 TaxID=3388653 RepID=UPI00398FA5A7
MSLYDAEHLDRTSSELIEAIEQAAWNKCDWNIVTDIFTSYFPGARAILLNHDKLHQELCFSRQSNFDPLFIDSYNQYYAYKNPWIDVWSDKKSGTVLIAEENYPARMYRGTEFYEDWILPQAEVEGAVGLKIEGDDDYLMHLPIHYPLAMTKLYDKPVAEVLRRIRTALLDAVRVTRTAGKAWEAAASATATLSSRESIFIVDEEGRLKNGNQCAEEALIRGTVFSRAERLRFGNPTTDKWFSMLIKTRQSSDFIGRSCHVFPTRSGDLMIEVLALPKPEWPLLPRSKRLFAVMIRDVSNIRVQGMKLFSERFRLTRSENDLCSLLAQGLSIREVANTLGLAEDTIRKRTKSIFQKTDTHRQGQLIGLINKYL